MEVNADYRRQTETLIELSTGGFLVKYVTSPDRIFFCKVSALGDFVWRRPSPFPISPFPGEHEVFEKNKIITGLLVGNGFYQLDSMGNPLRSHLLNTNSGVRYSFMPRPLGGYWLKYAALNNTVWHSHLIQLDANFNIVSNRRFNLDLLLHIGAATDTSLLLYGRNVNNLLTMIELDTLEMSNVNLIRGNLNTTCSNNTFFPNWLVSATASNNGAQFFATTDSLSRYEIQTDTGVYTIQAYPPAPVWTSTTAISNQTTIGQTDTIPLIINCLTNCSRLTVDLSTPFLRRCFPAEYTVRYCNTGTQTASQGSIEVKLDSLLEFLSASIPVTRRTGQLFRFDIGTVRPNECNTFNISVRSACGDSTRLGQALCSQVRIYPDSICALPSNWSGANIQVTGACELDSVHFTVSNLGRATSSALRQLVLEDTTVISNRLITVAANRQQHFRYLAQGGNWRMSVEQEPLHPYGNTPIAVVEGCNWLPTSRPKTSLTTTLPLDTRNPVFRTFCNTLQGSFDPNDKMSFPIGYGTRHLIEPNQDIEYMIRFQNTGTDTAFTVVVTDTLSKLLDVRSIEPLSASHAYRWTILKGNVVEFTFPNILLVDSFHNEPHSHGFVKFHIKQQPNVPLGSTIYNDASIFFDFNAPVITNRTWLTVGKSFIVSGVSDEASKMRMRIVSYPNPTTDRAILELLDAPNDASNRTFQLFDATGKLLRINEFSGNRFELERADLKAGFYIFRVEQHGQVLGTGRIVVQ
jgi:uncharacterized repeat protein (TIGR01451 family)